MTESSLPNRREHYDLLIKDVSQFQVDFVIPRLGSDIGVGIDPFLLFRSRDKRFRDLHSIALRFFNFGLDFIRQDRIGDAAQLFRFPEVHEIGFGYAKSTKEGAGVGHGLTNLIIEALRSSPALQERSIRHIEELQLIALGIAEDRTSDIFANIAKEFLIEYTQEQCSIWNIPLTSNVPVHHVLNLELFSWYDGYFDLPVSEFNNKPMIFVPRSFVRTLPWINYKDFKKSLSTTYLNAMRHRIGTSFRSSKPKLAAPKLAKPEVVALNRADVERIDKYLDDKEVDADNALPTDVYLDSAKVTQEAEELKARLTALPTGETHSKTYQLLILEILNFVFNPDLVDGRPEVRTVHGTERRDLVFTNESRRSFWAYLTGKYSSIFLMFEVKNTKDIPNEYLNQTATYLGKRLGKLGFLITRNPLKDPQKLKAIAVFNNDEKVILSLSDGDLLELLDLRTTQGGDPMKFVQNVYREFIMSLQ